MRSIFAQEAYRHIKNIFDEGELARNAVVAEFATTAPGSTPGKKGRKK